VTDKQLYISACDYLLPEISFIVQQLDNPTVKVLGFHAGCTTKSINLEKVFKVLSETNKQSASVILFTSSCHIRGLNDFINFPHLNIIQLKQCFNLFLNPELIDYYLQQGSYLVTNGWLRHYEKHIKNWGFDEISAKSFFKESLKKIVLLDTKIPGDLMKELKALSDFMGLPYEILPTGLSFCENYITKLVAEWLAENERTTTNHKLAAVSKKYTDYYVVFKHLDTLIQLVDETQIIKVIFELIYILFAPENISYTAYFDDEKSSAIHYKNDKQSDLTDDRTSFSLEVRYQQRLLGVFQVCDIQFPKYLEQYKEMGRVISQICALAIANARKYQLLEDQKEKLLTFTNELQQANEAKDKFLSVLSHDLKSPFNLLIGYTDLLVSEIDKGNTDEIKEYSIVIQETLQNTWNLLVNLLEWSRNRSGLVRLFCEEIIIKEFLNEHIPLFRQHAFKKEINLHISISENLTIFADRSMLNTIIRNLLSNSIKYTHHGGEITIKAMATKRDTIISISDTGVGMSPEKISRLFHIENNISTPGTDYENGTGLGLLLCKDLVERHKGKIWVDSEPNTGSTFYIALPNEA
jgi:two-component system, sensor histidine kinase and response regulator